MCRNKEVRVKLKKEELDIIKARAKEMGVEASVYLRIMGLKSKFKAEIH